MPPYPMPDNIIPTPLIRAIRLPLQDHIKEVENKWNTLKMNDDIWAKLIYFEQNRRLAKAYVSAPVLTVDGSTNGLDGFRIGLSGIDNDYRSLDSVACLRAIGQGVKLRIDYHGNILIKKIGRARLANQCSVFVKDWPSVSTMQDGATAVSDSNDENNCTIREIEQSDTSYKLFDMNKFRMQIERQKSLGDKTMDWRQCVSIISFVRNANDQLTQEGRAGRRASALRDPCWLMIINIIAIDMLKSSICDNGNFMHGNQLPGADGIKNSKVTQSSTLVQDHRILSTGGRPNPGNHNLTPDGNVTNNPTRTRHDIPLRASSSASVLYPPTGTMSKDYSNTDVLRRDYYHPKLQQHNMASCNDRIKKLRTTHNRYGRASATNDDSYYRQYQSTQQMANNTIYTTFNSKFINLKQSKPLKQNSSLADDSSTSNYHSTGDFSYWNHYQNGRQQEQQHLSNYCPTDTIYPRILSSNPKKLYRDPNELQRQSKADYRAAYSFNRPTLVAKNKSLSLSNFELEPGRRELEFLPSYIKMNFDDDENDDPELPTPPPSSSGTTSASSRLANSLEDEATHYTESKHRISGTTNSRIGDSRKSPSRNSPQQQKEQADHNGCPLIEGCCEMTEMDSAHQQKVSRSSIASSSSSSGCIDNDYFMSNSSSSMSSSTRSNECEMFSQQASSSGIVCSGSTSDECDDGRKSSNAANGHHHHNHIHIHHDKREARKALQAENSDTPTTKTSNAVSNGISSKNRAATRANSMLRANYKTINSLEQSPINFSCEHNDLFGDCDCGLEPTGYDCDCCCDCAYGTTGCPPTVRSDDSANDYNAGESIYDRPPFPPIAAKQSPVNAKSRSNSMARLTPKPSSHSMNRGSSLASIGEDFDKVSSIPYNGDDLNTNDHMPSTTKDRKGASWLERRKYMNMLPRFMFHGSNRSSQSGGSERKSKTEQQQHNSATGNKDGTPEGAGQFRRLTRSTQNLSACLSSTG